MQGSSMKRSPNVTFPVLELGILERTPQETPWISARWGLPQTEVPQSHRISNRIFHSKPSSYWGTPICGPRNPSFSFCHSLPKVHDPISDLSSHWTAQKKKPRPWLPDSFPDSDENNSLVGQPLGKSRHEKNRNGQRPEIFDEVESFFQ